MRRLGWRDAGIGLVVLLALPLMGCAPSARGTVTGTVKLEGELADHGTIAFHPIAGGPMAHGTIGEDGSYRLLVGASDSGRILPGEYVVTVVVPQEPRPSTGSGPPPPMMRLSDQTFADRNSSPLRASVKEGDNVFHFEVTVADDFDQQIEGIIASEDRSAPTDVETEDAAEHSGAEAAAPTTDAADSGSDSGEATESAEASESNAAGATADDTDSDGEDSQ
ncbi:MAG: hypothetical protein AAGF97_03495 [Planctomycetota bacterium]